MTKLNFLFNSKTRLRRMLKGYSDLRKTDNLGFMRDLDNHLCEVKLNVIRENKPNYFFGSNVVNLELVVRQYLIQKFVGRRIHRSILFALGNRSKVVFPLPRVWQRKLIGSGLDIAVIRSSFMWVVFLYCYYGRNLVAVCRMVLQAVLAQFVLKKNILPYAYLADLSKGNLPQSSRSGKSYDICSWYARWGGRSSSVKAIRHNISGQATEAHQINVEGMNVPPYLVLVGWRRIGKLVAFCFIASLIAGFNLIRGRWWYGLLLFEAAKGRAVALTNREHLASEYLFHYSGNIYRPLWTYEAAKKGSRIVSYFYSISEQPKLASGYQSHKAFVGASSWPLFLVWDEYQKEWLLREVSNDPKIEVVNPIWFSDSPERLQIGEPAVAVFDFEFYRLTFHFPFSTNADYFAAFPDLPERFLGDVHQVLSEYGFKMVFKRKRVNGRQERKSYKKLLNNLSTLENVTFVSPEHSAFKIIDQSIGVISLPFTSTAQYLGEQRIPSIYYDPTGWIQRNDRAAHGVPIIQGVDELRAWAATTLPHR